MEITLPSGRAGRLLALFVTLLVLVILWAEFVAPLADWYGERAQRLGQREAVETRMERLAAMLPDLKSRVDEAAKEGPPPTLTLDGASDAVAAATLQNMVQQKASSAGVTLASVEIVPAETVGAFRRIGLKLSLSVSWSVLVSLLQSIESGAPPILIDDIALHATPAPLEAGPQLLDASFTVYAFRALAPTEGSP